MVRVTELLIGTWVTPANQGRYQGEKLSGVGDESWSGSGPEDKWESRKGWKRWISHGRGWCGSFLGKSDKEIQASDRGNIGECMTITVHG